MTFFNEPRLYEAKTVLGGVTAHSEACLDTCGIPCKNDIAVGSDLDFSSIPVKKEENQKYFALWFSINFRGFLQDGR